MVYRLRRPFAGLREERRPFFQRYRKPLKAAAIVVSTVIVACAGYAISLNSKFGDIAQFDTHQIQGRPNSDQGKALNVLLLGADKGQEVHGSTPGMRLSQAVQAKNWPTGRYRSDTIMVVHVDADRRHVYLVSIPRDTYTAIYDPTAPAV